MDGGGDNKYLKMDVACVIDLAQEDKLAHRMKAFQEIKNTCSNLNINFTKIQVSYNKFIVKMYL